MIDFLHRFKNLICQSKYFNLYAFTLIVLLAIIVHIPDFQIGGVFAGESGGYLYFKSFIKDSILSGEFPLWNPYQANGLPVIGESIYGIFTPLAIPIFFIPFKYYFIVFVILHIITGAFFLYLYLSKIGCNKYVALLTAIIYEFSILVGGLEKHQIGLLANVIYLPVVMYFAECYLKERDIKFLVFCFLAMAFQFLTGFPQYALYTDIAVSIYMVFNVIRTSFPIKKFLIDFFISLVVYLGAICIQLLPTLKTMSYYKLLGGGKWKL